MALYVGDLAPEKYTLDIVPGDSGFDLSTVTAATIEVEKPSGATVSWAAVRSNQTALTLTLTFTLSAVTSELDESGIWRAYAKLTTPGGPRRTEVALVPVKRKWGR